jgi:hypothetical protein
MLGRWPYARMPCNPKGFGNRALARRRGKGGGFIVLHFIAVVIGFIGYASVSRVAPIAYGLSLCQLIGR